VLIQGHQTLLKERQSGASGGFLGVLAQRFDEPREIFDFVHADGLSDISEAFFNGVALRFRKEISIETIVATHIAQGFACATKNKKV
jgi:hypothetical protein